MLPKADKASTATGISLSVLRALLWRFRGPLWVLSRPLFAALLRAFSRLLLRALPNALLWALLWAPPRSLMARALRPFAGAFQGVFPAISMVFSHTKLQHNQSTTHPYKGAFIRERFCSQDLWRISYFLSSGWSVFRRKLNEYFNYNCCNKIRWLFS